MTRLLAAACTAVALLAAGAAHAQSNTTSTTTTSTTTTTTPAALSLDTPVETVAASPAGKAVLDKDLPGLTSHPMYEQFKSMSLRDLQPMSQGQITDDQLKQAGADLAMLPPK